MKIKFLLGAVLLAFAYSAVVSAQTVNITSKKTVYTRKFKVTSKEKRTFTVISPVVSGKFSPAVKKSLENTISYWRVFETTLNEHLNETDWLSEAYYKVNFNGSGVLNIALTLEGMGAYPSADTKTLVVDLKTGRQIKFDDAFRSDAREKLAALVDRKLTAEKKELIEAIAQDKESFSSDEDRKSVQETIKELKFTAENFNEFSVSARGATIFFDAGFPHAIQALEPDGRYFFTWAELKPYIRPDGLLGRFVR